MALADADRHRAGLAVGSLSQLQHQAVTQPGGAHTGGLQALQPLQRAVQSVGQFLAFLGGVLAVDAQGLAQPLGDVFERVGQVAIFVERVDQHHHRGGILGRQAHAQQLAAQVVLQRRAGFGRLDRLVVVVAAARAAAGRWQFADAVEIVAFGAVFPVVALGAAELGSVHAGRLFGAAVSAVLAFGQLVLLALGALVSRGADALESELHRRVVFLDIQEWVLLEHLLDFLVQFQRRELQQPDRLLQLRRQRQVLRQPDLERGFHR